MRRALGIGMGLGLTIVGLFNRSPDIDIGELISQFSNEFSSEFL